MSVCIPTTVIVDPVDGNLHDFQSVAVISTVSMNNLVPLSLCCDSYK